jgi:hypothetical protein
MRFNRQWRVKSGLLRGSSSFQLAGAAKWASPTQLFFLSLVEELT